MDLVLYVITEIVEVDCVDAFVTTNNHVKDKEEAFNMFLTRRMPKANLRWWHGDYSLTATTVLSLQTSLKVSTTAIIQGSVRSARTIF